MKRYLLVGIALLFVNANASLKENFAQMDLEEEQLLNEMRKSAALNDDLDEEEEVKEDSAVPENVEEKEIVTLSPENDLKMADSGTNTNQK